MSALQYGYDFDCDADQGRGGWVPTPPRGAVIFDLDSTLADTRHRREFMPADPQVPADWIDYHSRCADDAPIAGRIALARLLAERHEIIIVTARPAAALVRRPTLAWLHRHDVRFHQIVFMPLDEERSTGEWKASVVENFRRTWNDIALFVDDWWQNGDELEKLGVPFLHVTPPGIGRPRPAAGALVPERLRPPDTGPTYLYRVVERPLYAVDDSGLPWGGEWKWAGTGWGRPRTYRTLRAARSVASRLRAQYQRAGVQMEVAVQTAPIGIWRAVE